MFVQRRDPNGLSGWLAYSFGRLRYTDTVTLFGEVINVLDRDNVRANPPSIDGRTWQARHLYETMIPIVPSAGVLIEF